MGSDTLNGDSTKKYDFLKCFNNDNSKVKCRYRRRVLIVGVGGDTFLSGADFINVLVT